MQRQNGVNFHQTRCVLRLLVERSCLCRLSTRSFVKPGHQRSLGKVPRHWRHNHYYVEPGFVNCTPKNTW